MKDHPISRFREWSLKKKLFGYMLLLVLLILIVLAAGLSLFDRFDSVEQSTYASLDVQMEVFGDDITNHFDALGTACISLSRQTSDLLEQHLQAEAMTFSQLTDSQEQLLRLQEVLLELLEQQLFQVDCSGVFALLDTTVNSSLPQAEKSRSGLYLQTTGYDSTDREILLLRGFSQLARENGMMPHRKWRLEFQTDLFPCYDTLRSLADRPAEEAYLFTDPCVLPGTSDRVCLAAIPIIGSDGAFYGICGFEMSASLFDSIYAQPTKLERLVCLLAPGAEGTIPSERSLFCGNAAGYVQIPKGDLTGQELASGLQLLRSQDREYVGLTRQITLSPNNDPHRLAVMIPKEDYDQARNRGLMQNTVMWCLILFFAAGCCFLFSRRFLAPILHDLGRVRTARQDGLRSSSPEIVDLFAFLAEKDQQHEQTLNELLDQASSANERITQLQEQYSTVQSKYRQAQAQIEHLAYSRSKEVDPDDYQVFLHGLRSLTPTERKIFDYYLDGMSVKDIISAAAIKESTVRYHNQNIYSKLGVNSLKQMLRYASLMRQQELASSSNQT